MYFILARNFNTVTINSSLENSNFFQAKKFITNTQIVSLFFFSCSLLKELNCYRFWFRKLLFYEVCLTINFHTYIRSELNCWEVATNSEGLGVESTGIASRLRHFQGFKNNTVHKQGFRGLHIFGVKNPYENSNIRIDRGCFSKNYLSRQEQNQKPKKSLIWGKRKKWSTSDAIESI